MDILELLPFLRRVAEPQTPADTLPVITQRLNGSSGDPTQVSQAISEMLDARSRWTVHKQELDVHLQKLVAEGADEKKRRPVRDAVSRASEEIKLLGDGEAPLKQRLVKARADIHRARQQRHQDTFAAEAKEILEAIRSRADRAGELIKRVERGELDIKPSVGMMVLPPLKVFADRRSEYEAALATLDRLIALAPEAPQAKRSAPAAAVSFVSTDGRTIDLPAQPTLVHSVSLAGPEKVAAPAKPTQLLQHTVGAGRPDNILPELGTPSRPRKPDDLSPLEPGEMRVKVIRAGYETPDGQQCDAGQIVKLPIYNAQKALGNSAVVAVEMNIDRTDVQGAGWQDTDQRTSLAFLGTGGISMTQHPDKPVSAPTHEKPNQGT